MAKTSPPPAVASEVIASSATCRVCGEVLDIGATGCRACGEGIEDPPDVLDAELINAALDELGEWSQIKHEILDKYAHAYTRIVTKQPLIQRVLYIDAFAGSGYGIDRDTGEHLQARHFGDGECTELQRAPRVAPVLVGALSDHRHYAEGA